MGDLLKTVRRIAACHYFRRLYDFVKLTQYGAAILADFISEECENVC